MTARRVCLLLFLGAALVWSPVGGLLEFQPRGGGDCRASRRGQRSDLKEGGGTLAGAPSSEGLAEPPSCDADRRSTGRKGERRLRDGKARRSESCSHVAPDSLTAAPLPLRSRMRVVTVCHFQPSSSRRSSASCCVSDTAEASNTIPSSINQIKLRISQFGLKPDLIFRH